MNEHHQRFVLHWGEMGTRWGVNRSVAQVHALLFLADEPLPADVMVETLGIARSNISTSLKELQSWDLIKVVHVLGDRRDHFMAEQSPEKILRLIAEGRKKREIDPTLATLKNCIVPHDDSPANQRIQAMLAFMEQSTALYDTLKSLPSGQIEHFSRLLKDLQAIWQGAEAL
jgi:DNA-binding transcriptional regulator GbsR (MarR family)